MKAYSSQLLKDALLKEHMLETLRRLSAETTQARASFR